MAHLPWRTNRGPRTVRPRTMSRTMPQTMRACAPLDPWLQIRANRTGPAAARAPKRPPGPSQAEPAQPQRAPPSTAPGPGHAEPAQPCLAPRAAPPNPPRRTGPGVPRRDPGNRFTTLTLLTLYKTLGVPCRRTPPASNHPIQNPIDSKYYNRVVLT